MKKTVFILFTMWTLCALAACGGSRTAAKATAGGGAATVAQLMEDAGRQTEPEAPAENAVEAQPPAEMEPVAQQPTPERIPTADGVDIDLTQMNATMVYAEVSNIMYMPDDYVGKIIRMNGMAVSSTDPETNITYHAVIIRDATACCASGLDYVLADGQEYPPDETDVTVTGEFELYEEDGFFFCQLKDAVLIT